MAVDGERLDGKYVGSVLRPGAAEYRFTVLRGGDAMRGLESALDGIAQQIWSRSGSGGLSVLEIDGELAVKAEGIVRTLESEAEKLGTVSEQALCGYWRMSYTNAVGFIAGGGWTGVGEYAAEARMRVCFRRYASRLPFSPTGLPTSHTRCISVQLSGDVLSAVPGGQGAPRSDSRGHQKRQHRRELQDCGPQRGLVDERNKGY